MARRGRLRLSIFSALVSWMLCGELGLVGLRIYAEVVPRLDGAASRCSLSLWTL